jgi:hypothetical protein
MGAAAALDRDGRWTVAGGAITLFGVAIGPGIAGELIERWPETGLLTLVVGCAVVGLPLLLSVTIPLDRGTQLRPVER